MNASGEFHFCRLLSKRSRRAPHTLGRGRGRGRHTGRQEERGRNNPRNHHTKSAFKVKFNSCGMANHHANLCHFIFKLRQFLSYMGVHLEAAFKNKQHHQERNTYNNNRNYARSLMDAGFIPLNGAGEDNFIDNVNGNHLVFKPDIIFFGRRRRGTSGQGMTYIITWDPSTLE